MGNTTENLKEAFAGESQASTTYRAFAQKADQEGHPHVARLFRAASAAEVVHARNHLQAMDGVHSTEDNLKAAIKGENTEHVSMYPEFVEQAKKEANAKAERTFDWARQVEIIHEGLYKAALEAQMEVVIKLDGDGQMDPAIIPRFLTFLEAGEADYCKGNRFYRPATLTGMPASRIAGNAVLSFLTKLSSGYWQVFDPTNGYTAIHASALRLLPLESIDTDASRWLLFVWSLTRNSPPWAAPAALYRWPKMPLSKSPLPSPCQTITKSPSASIAIEGAV